MIENTIVFTRADYAQNNIESIINVVSAVIAKFVEQPANTKTIIADVTELEDDEIIVFTSYAALIGGEKLHDVEMIESVDMKCVVKHSEQDASRLVLSIQLTLVP